MTDFDPKNIIGDYATIEYGDGMKQVVANLVDRGEIDFTELMSQGYGTTLSKGELAIWLNHKSSSLQRRAREKVEAFDAKFAAELRKQHEAELREQQAVEEPVGASA